MDQDKRLFLAFALSFAVLILWRTFLVKPLPQPPKPVPATKAQVTQSQPPKPGGVRPATLASLPVRHGKRAQEFVVEGNLYRVTLSTEGAVIKSWALKKYEDERGTPLDVVNRAACEQVGFPMSLSLADQALSDRLNKAFYVADVQPSNASLSPPIKIQFAYSDGKVEVRKEFAFGPGYEVHVEASVRDSEGYLPVEVDWAGGFGDQSLPVKVREAVTQAVYGTVGNVTKIPERKMEGDRRISDPFEFAGLEDRYFVDMLLPDSSGSVFRISRQAWNPPDWTGKDPPRTLTVLLGSPQPRPLGFRLFVAPKDLDVLRSEKPPLDGVVDFGWFTFVAKPLFIALRYIYVHWVHNYGWAIVILTVIINLLMFPLKLKSIRSAQEMQRIAPIVKSIQDRYKQYKFNDPRRQRMNEEVMKLYKEHGINPLGGCFPMLLQIPFLYGFYRVLDLSIELRHAPWILWIKDLSMPDRFHLWGFPLPILPTVMIITMFILQKMTPVASADPAQQRMMMIMPLIFGIMFFNFAAGLVLYWLTGNIVGIAQQAFINRMSPAPAPQKASVPRKAVT